MRIITIDMNSARNTVLDSALIRQGENLASELQITLSNEFLGYSYYLLLRVNNNAPIISPYLIPNERSVIRYALTSAVTASAGRLKIEIHAVNGDGALVKFASFSGEVTPSEDNTLIKSAIYSMEIKPSLDGTSAEVMPTDYVPWYNQVIQAVDSANALFGQFSEAEAIRQAGYNAFESDIAGLKADKTTVEALNSEVILARDTKSTLGARLDADKAEVSAQLAEIKGLHSPMKILCLFYGNPIEINNANNIEKAAEIYSNYDIVIFNGGIEEPNHRYHENTKAIVTLTKELNPNIEIFGYIHSHDPSIKDLTSSQPFLTIEVVEDKVNKWKNLIGATGIFLDAFGYDFEVSRNRQNQLVTACRGYDMPVIVNSWRPDYVFSNRNLLAGSFYGNPDGLPCIIGENDYYIFENHIYTRSYYTDGFQEANDSKRVYQAIYYRYATQEEFNGRTYYDVYKTKTLSLNGLQEPNERFFNEAYLVALACGCHGFGMSGSSWSDPNYSHFIPPQVTGSDKEVRLQSYTYNEAAEELSIKTHVNKHEVSVRWDQADSIKSAYDFPNEPYRFYCTLTGTMNVNSKIQVSLSRVSFYPSLLLGDTAEVSAQKIANFDYGSEWTTSVDGTTIIWEYNNGNPEFFKRGAGGANDNRGMYLYLNSSKGMALEYDVLSVADKVVRRITLNGDFLHSSEGTTALRPVSPKKGFSYFDSTLNKAIWWNGTNYVDANGQVV